MAATDITPVYMDLDTDGGVSGNHELYEIAAISGNMTFSEKIIGCQNLPKHRGKQLPNLLSLKDALIEFLNWLASLGNRKVLVAHNARNFDAIILIQSLDECNIRIPMWIEFGDTIDLIRVLREFGLFESEGITFDCCLRELLNKRQDRIHDALTDAINLSRICDKATELLGVFPTYEEVMLLKL